MLIFLKTSPFIHKLTYWRVNHYTYSPWNIKKSILWDNFIKVFFKHNTVANTKSRNFKVQPPQVLIFFFFFGTSLNQKLAKKMHDAQKHPKAYRMTGTVILFLGTHRYWCINALTLKMHSDTRQRAAREAPTDLHPDSASASATDPPQCSSLTTGCFCAWRIRNWAGIKKVSSYTQGNGSERAVTPGWAQGTGVISSTVFRPATLLLTRCARSSKNK